MDVNQFSIHLKKFIWIGILLMITSGVWAQSEPKVFVTKTGAKYHSSSCRYAQTGWEATLTEAKERKLTACLVCKPGGGSTSTPANSSFTETNGLRSTTPTSNKPAASTSSSQCSATTKAGSRCSRKASAGSAYCWQHGDRLIGQLQIGLDIRVELQIPPSPDYDLSTPRRGNLQDRRIRKWQRKAQKSSHWVCCFRYMNAIKKLLIC